MAKRKKAAKPKRKKPVSADPHQIDWIDIREEPNGTGLTLYYYFRIRDNNSTAYFIRLNSRVNSADVLALFSAFNYDKPVYVTGGSETRSYPGTTGTMHREVATILVQW